MLGEQMAEHQGKMFDCPEYRKDQKTQRAWVLDQIAAGEDIDIISNSDIVLGQIRLCVAQKMLKPEDVQVIYYASIQGDKMHISVLPSGALNVWPHGFMCENENISLNLLALEGRK